MPTRAALCSLIANAALNRTMPRGRPPYLPEYESPPIAEVALSLQFAPILQFQNIHAGLLWKNFMRSYPDVEEQPPIAPVFETFGMPPALVPAPQIQLLTTMPGARYWFISADGNELLQVQQDRLIHNWRRQSEGDKYPRYETLRKRFYAEVEKVRKFLKAEKMGAISPNQCEVTYINHIDFGDGGDPTSHFGDVFSLWCDEYSNDFLQHIEGGLFNVRYVLEDDRGEPYGRLHASAQHVIHRRTSRSLIQFTLVARGKPKQETLISAFEWLDQGRAAIVKGFDALTRPEMHERWRRINANS